MSKLPDEFALWIRRQSRQNQPFLLWQLQTVLLFLGTVTQPNHNSKLKWNSEKRDIVPWKSRSECPSSKVGWVVNSELKNSFSKDSYRKASTLRAFAAMFTCLPTAREVKALLETSSPEKWLQWALDLWPLAWLYGQLDLIQYNSALLPYFLGLKGHRTVVSSPSLPSISLFLALSFYSSAVLPSEEWSCGQDENQAVTLVRGLSSHSCPPDSLCHGRHVPLP